ncbi:MAG TPA: hypothetical protein PK725_15760 [Rhodocyclaceae bacterium]|nr:hypothetical protein [Rhodocyclaceae bacterium]HRQ48411.1 hypothetical protein [Rhodocyclaceae bacterium]
MNIEAGPILFALILGVVLASGVAWFVSGLYRRRMLALMRGGPSPDDARARPEAGPAAMPAHRPTPRLDPAANRRASLRYLLAMSVLCVLIGLTQSWLALLFVYANGPFSLNRLVVLGLVYAWPMVMAWGLLRRWSWSRIVTGIAAYMIAMAGVVILASDGNQTLAGVSAWLGGVVAIPVLVTLLIGSSGRIRAVAPYLLPVFLLLSAASVVALEMLAQGIDDPPAWLLGLVGTVGAHATLLLVALAPWLVLAWPVWALARWLAHAYRDKRFSDLGYLFAAYWFVVLASSALPALQAVGLIGLTQLLPWLWLPLAARVLDRRRAPPDDPATLLVLRVFQQDAKVEALFDRVVERWRLTGNTVLIAGTDLVSRTLDPDDLFTFLDGRLAGRFIANEAELAARMAAFDLAPDPDGRYRVNECYCFDTTWQAALAALVRRSDVVLMDLRGFRAGNRGCRHELGVLADAAHLRRVVLLHDATTQRDVAEADIARAAPERFVWVEAEHLGGARAGKVLAALFGGRQIAGIATPA